MNLSLKASFLLSLLILLNASCKKETDVNSQPNQANTKSSENRITALTFSSFTPPIEATIDEKNHKITATVPATADLKNLTPTIVISPKASVSPNSKVSQDFTNAVIYTVSAEDGKKQDYEVKVQKEAINNNGSTTGIEGTMFFGDTQSNIYAIDTDNGKEKWSYKLEVERETSVNNFFSTPIIGNGILYVSVIDKIHAIDALTGAKKWTATGTGTPAIADGVLFTTYQSNSIRALDATTGVQKWISFALSSNSNRPVATNQMVYSTGIHKKIYAVNIKDGKTAWELTPKTNSISPTNASSTPLIIDNTIYVVYDYRLYAFDANTGAQKWNQQDAQVNYKFTISDGIIYSSSITSDAVVLIDAKTGTIKKSINIGEPIFSYPCCDNGSLYVGCEKKIHAFDASTGSKKWTSPTNSFATGSFIAIDQILYAGCEKNMYAIDANTGKQKWVFSTPEWSIGKSPTILTKSGRVVYPNHFHD